jgi:ribosomal protein S5
MPRVKPVSSSDQTAKNWSNQWLNHKAENLSKSEKPDDGMREKMISINRVTKVVKGRPHPGISRR